MGTMQSFTGEGVEREAVGGGAIAVFRLLKTAQLFPYTYESRLSGAL